MHTRSHVILGGIFLWLAAELAVANEIRLLDGQLSLATPVDVSPRRLAPTQSPRFSVLTDQTSSDSSFSVLVTYGKGSSETRNLADFLRDKVSSYNTLNGKVPHFRWVEHQVVERNGRQWAEICYSHDTESGAHVYTRCLSCFVQGHLLEIWALTRRAADSAQQGYVDQLIGSVRLTS